MHGHIILNFKIIFVDIFRIIFVVVNLLRDSSLPSGREMRTCRVWCRCTPSDCSLELIL